MRKEIYQLESGRYYDFSANRFTTQKSYRISEYWTQIREYQDYSKHTVKECRRYLKGKGYEEREAEIGLFRQEMKRRKHREELKGKYYAVGTDIKGRIDSKGWFETTTQEIESFEYLSSHILITVMKKAIGLEDYLKSRLSWLRISTGFRFKLLIKSQARKVISESVFFEHKRLKDYEWTLDRAFIVIIDILKRRKNLYKLASGKIKIKIIKD